jgi:hypothetical protein
MADDLNIELNPEENAVEITGIEPGQEASKEAIGAVLSKLHKMMDQKLVEEDQKKKKLYSAESFAKVFKVMHRQDKPTWSRATEPWIYFWARKPKSCTGCKMYNDACHWGFETVQDGKKIRPKSGTCCIPFKIRGYKLTDEEVELHRNSLIAHVHDLMDQFEELIDKGIV